MATGQTILDRMELLDQELQLQAAEADVVRGLVAVNMAQDYFESLVAQEPDLLGDTSSTLQTTAAQETTTWPTGLLRLDRLVMLNDDSLPEYELDSMDSPPTPGSGFAWVTPGRPGKPTAFWTNGRQIYWDRVPDATYTLRWHGLQVAADVTAAGTITYPDIVLTPFAAFAVAVLQTGVGDSPQDISGIANATLSPAITSLAHFVRDRARGFRYTYHHTT